MKNPAFSSVAKHQTNYFPYLFAVLFFFVFFDSWRRAEVNPFVFFEQSAREHLWTFITGMFPPELSWNFLSLMFQPALETIQISIMGTLIAVMIGFPLGLLATRTFIVGGILNEDEIKGSVARFGIRFFLYCFTRGGSEFFSLYP